MLLENNIFVHFILCYFYGKVLLLIRFYLERLIILRISAYIYLVFITAWKVPVSGVFLVCIFPHLDQKNFEYGYFSRSVY